MCILCIRTIISPHQISFSPILAAQLSPGHGIGKNIHLPLHNHTPRPHTPPLPITHHHHEILVPPPRHPIISFIPPLLADLPHGREHAQDVQEAGIVVGALERAQGVVFREGGGGGEGGEGGEEARGEEGTAGGGGAGEVGGVGVEGGGGPHPGIDWGELEEGSRFDGCGVDLWFWG